MLINLVKSVLLKLGLFYSGPRYAVLLKESQSYNKTGNKATSQLRV